MLGGRAALAPAPPDPPDAGARKNAPPRSYLLRYRRSPWPRKYLEWAVKDPVNLFTRPAFWDTADRERLAAGSAATAVAFTLDERVWEATRGSRSDALDAVRDAFSNPVEIHAAALFLAGLAARNEKLADTGFLALESVIWAKSLSGLSKSVTHRERPRAADDPWEFHGHGGSTRDGTSAFVSGDTIGVFAFAASVSEVWKKKWLTRTLYALAALVALQRIDFEAHWLSDVTGAALIGHAVGRRIVRFHQPDAARYRATPAAGGDAVAVSASIRF